MNSNAASASQPNGQEHSDLRMFLNIAIVSIGAILTFAIDPGALDFYLLLAASFLGILANEDQYYRGPRIAFLIFGFAAVILMSFLFGFAFLTIGDAAQEPGRTYLLAGVAGIVGAGNWLTGFVTGRR